jgi:hypothetical protein
MREGLSRVIARASLRVFTDSSARLFPCLALETVYTLFFQKGDQEKRMAAPAKKAPKNTSQTPRRAARKSATKPEPAATAKAKSPEVVVVSPSKVAEKSETAATPAPAEAKAKRARKEKVVRDSFTMPKSEYARIASLKQKCLDGGVRVKKSELLRAALAMLDAVPAKRLIAAVGALEAVKTGRPSNT